MSKTSFYPHGKPGVYSYTKHFLEVGHDTEEAAVANTKYPGIDGGEKAVTNRALDNLQVLINAARNAELAFLSDTGINLQDPNASSILRNINQIFNSKGTFERGMKYMKSMTSSGKDIQKNEMYRDVTRYFGTYLNQILKEELKKFLTADIVEMNPAAIQNLINDIIGDALVRTYERVKDLVDKDNGKIQGKFGKNHTVENREEVQAVQDMISVIQTLQKSGAFKEYGHLFGLTTESLMEITNRKDRRYSLNLKKGKFTGAQVDANFGGNILELITSVIAAEIGNINIAGSGLTITGVHTGQMNQMKADTMLFVGRGEVNPSDYLELVDKQSFDSVRMQNVDAMDQYLKKLDENLRHVIMISDKNYSITANFGGINAQEKMNIGAAMGMLNQFGVGNTVELLNYLANCGPSMVQGDVNGEVRTELQTLIGYFLFDHLQIQVNGTPPGPNVVNLLNVSGIYIPLSVYLEGVYNSIKSALGSPSSFVSVTISLGGETDESNWTAANWVSFRHSHDTESFISYRILSGITEFLSGL